MPVAPAATPAAIVMPAPAGAPWSADGLAALQRDLDALLDGAPALRGAHAGVLVVDTATGATLYSRNADDEFQPASTLKLVVGSAALDRLGPQYRFRTSVEIDRALANAHRLVILTAGGDPFLTVHDIGLAAESVANSSHSPVTLQVDATRYDDQPYAAGWTWDDFAQDYAAPISAMTIEENVVHVTVHPGPRVGAAPTLTLSPDVTTPSSTPTSRVVGIAPGVGCPFPFGFPFGGGTATTVASGGKNTLDVERDTAGCNELTGEIPVGYGPSSLDVAVQDANEYGSRILENRLAAHGVTLVRAGDALRTTLRRIAAPFRPVHDVAWTHNSAPLEEWLGPRFWIPSDNLVAELLLKELGYATGGKPGTTAKGTSFEKTWLRSLGIDPATTTLADGSGMSQYDRITPRDLVTILQHDWNGPNRDLVLRSLPVGGARGTIEGIAGTPAAGRVFAKTGSMMHVRGLAGYLAPVNHGAITFAFNVDDWNGDYPALAALRAAVLARIVTDP